ncbi:unnamed protein product, partial [Laminaria digitata]
PGSTKVDDLHTVRPLCTFPEEYRLKNRSRIRMYTRGQRDEVPPVDAVMMPTHHTRTKEPDWHVSHAIVADRETMQTMCQPLNHSIPGAAFHAIVEVELAGACHQHENPAANFYVPLCPEM